MPFKTGIQVRPVDATRWELLQPLVYEGQSETFNIPAGYITDFASVPRIFVWLLPPFGDYTPAAIVHDYLITDLLPEHLITSRDVDGIFRRICSELNVKPRRKWLLWAGVRLGALASRSHRRYERGFRYDALKVALICLLALPVTLPGVIGVTFGLLCDSIIGIITGTNRNVWRT